MSDAETKRDNPWDHAVDAGYGYTDDLFSQWDGKAVSVVRNLQELTPEYMRITFPDGSVLYLGVDSGPVIEREKPASLGDAMERAWSTDAYTAYGVRLKALFDGAGIKEVDTDI